MRPGIANAFLLGFIESLADFGNPLVLGAEYDVLSTEIFFAIVGAQYDETKAAILAMILLSVVLVVFYLQNQWLGKNLIFQFQVKEIVEFTLNFQIKQNGSFTQQCYHGLY